MSDEIPFEAYEDDNVNVCFWLDPDVPLCIVVHDYDSRRRMSFTLALSECKDFISQLTERYNNAVADLNAIKVPALEQVDPIS